MNKTVNKELIKRGLSYKSNKPHPKKYEKSIRFIDGRIKYVTGFRQYLDTLKE